MPDLITLELVKMLTGNQLKGSVDAVLSSLITATSADFLRAIERPDLLSTAYSEIRIGDGSSRLVLRHWPVTAVSVLNVAGTALPEFSNASTTGWYLDTATDPERQFCLYLAGSSFPDGGLISVSYTAGYVDVPADIAQAVADWVIFRNNKRSTNGQTEQRSVEGERVTADPNIMPVNTQRVIDRYRKETPVYGRKPIGTQEPVEDAHGSFRAIKV